MDSTEKNDATSQPTLVIPDCLEDKAICLTPEEIVCRKSRLPYQKMKSRINISGLSAEEIDDLKDDTINNDRHTQ